MRELHLAANGLRFRCIADGPEDGPLALLLHGFPEGAESWSAQVPALAAAGYRAVAPDLRGYGGSDCPDGEEAYRMTHLVGDVVGLVDALGSERCHLAGHDWGALVGWSVASHHPERLLSWSALSVGHPIAFTDTIRDDPDQQARSSYVNLFLVRGKAESVLGEDGHRRLRRMYQVGPRPDAVPQAEVETFVRAMAPHPIRTPTQLIWGERDPAVGPASTRATGDHVEGEYRLEVLEGAGHWLQFERPGEVAHLLLDWMGRHP